MKKNKELKNSIVVYQAKSGAIALRRDSKADTIWASLDQIAGVFGRDKSVVSRHIKNIFAEGELKRTSVVAFFATTATDGKIYNVEHFNLDVIISIGYRVNSKQATQFRQWATKTLRQYIVDGYAINKQRIAKNYEQFLEAVESVKRILPAGTVIDTEDILELVNLFADTWLSLDAYDKGILATKGTTKRRVAFTAKKLQESLAKLKTALMEKGEATEHFGMERQSGSISGIVGNVMQSFDGKEFYGSVEEKAAHLLYFIVKNHPFVDGNKRSGAYAFVWFLRQANILDTTRMTAPALTALTILVAESNPKEKERVVGLILTLVAKN